MDPMSLVGPALKFFQYVKRLLNAPNEVDGVKGEIDELRQQLSTHERRIAFLEVFREVHVQALQRIHDLQAIQENQRVKLRNLEERIENLMFLIETIQKMEPGTDERQEIIKLERSVKNHLGRARTRAAV